MDLIPAIDIIDGQCVRLTQGDYARKKIYFQHPLEAAKKFEAAGLRRLHVVDLDGAKASRIINHRILQELATHTNLQIDFGGGIKSDEDIRIAFESGARQVTAGTVAVKNKPLFLSWLERYGGERLILGADVRNEFLAVNGWQETSPLSLFDFLEDYITLGIQEVICTDIAKDGLLKGPSIDLYRRVLDRFPALRLIASGGVASRQDLEELKAIGCHGAIIGKAIYEGRLQLKDLKS